jgi:hypothetical protein
MVQMPTPLGLSFRANSRRKSPARIVLLADATARSCGRTHGRRQTTGKVRHTERKEHDPDDRSYVIGIQRGQVDRPFGTLVGIHLGGAVSYLNRLVLEPALLVLVLPLLKRESEGWYVAYRWSAPDESYSLQVFVWPSGTATRSHDHASWGAYACALVPSSRSATSAWTMDLAGPRAFEEVPESGVERRRWCVDRAALRRGHPPDQ